MGDDPLLGVRDCLGVSEQAGQAAGVEEHGLFGGLDVAVPDGGGQVGRGPAGVDGVEGESVGAGGAPVGLSRGGGERCVPSGLVGDDSLLGVRDCLRVSE
ncbi:hypothetical protein AB0I54_23955 [Streptomyces sp. NPDC050625]|uniref:hypothetical protein n=1 Tax=Streptomyces sp. NPDC050625 TaxID=3154629 RepID=UPI00343EDE81